jgi:formylmethanofuran dehydrogenase subunit C
MKTKIIRNIARCMLCGDIIESKYRHDWQSCSCGEIFVDGGLDYLRRGANDFKNLIEMSESECTP